LTASLTGQIDMICDRFEAAWRDGKQPRIEEFLGDETLQKGPTQLRELLVELVKVDLEWRWKSPPVETISSKQASESTAGAVEVHLPSKPRLEHYCEQYPALGPADQLPDEVIVAEYRARHRWGDKPSYDEYQQRFPGKADALEDLLEQTELVWARGATELAAGASGKPGTPRPLKSITLDQFLQNIEASRLMAADEVSQFQESLPPDEKPGEGHTLAERLVEAEKLTHYQAEQVCRGEVELLAFDEYVILDRIGAGGMGQVLKAEHRSMQRLVALKMISPKLVDSPEAVKRFRREVRAAAKLIHPNIVVAHDAREHTGRHCLVMEYVDGQDLGMTVKREGPLPVGATVDYMIQAARGLAFAHEQRIIHRDIKPGNLLLDKRGAVKILDMGLARLDDATEDEPDSDQLTGTSQTMGTCDYMAPEQAMDTHGVDHRADIYSLGCTLYRLLTGKRPYSGVTPMQVYVAHREDPIPSLSEARDDVPRELDAVFQKMVAKKPEDRQQSMTEVIGELQACVGEDDEDRPSDSALTAFLQDVQGSGVGSLRGGSRTGLTKGADSGRTVAGEAGQTAPIAPALPLARRLKLLWTIGGPVLAVALLIGLLVVLVGGPEEKLPTPGTLVVEGPLGEVEIAAKHEDDDLYRRLELDGEGRVELKPGEYRFGLPRGHETHRLVPDRITVLAGEQVAVRIEPKAGDADPWMAILPADAPAPAVASFDARAAEQHQEAWAKYLGVSVEITNRIGMTLRLLPPGEFVMGSTEEEIARLPTPTERYRHEGPQHRVRITKPLYLGRHEVTVGQFRAFVEASEYKTEAESDGQGGRTWDAKGTRVHRKEITWQNPGFEQTDDHPVVQVSWNDCVAFCRWLKEEEGKTYGLPTEAQWEYACRSGSKFRWCYGNHAQDLEQYAWYSRKGGNYPNPVGQKAANGFGLFDLHGNVWEWCVDRYGEDYYGSSPMDDPTGPTLGSERVNRGGSWAYDWGHCRSADRRYDLPGYRNDTHGFRVACLVDASSR